MLTLPASISRGVVASIDAVAPEGYLVKITESGRGMLVDSAFGMTTASCFWNILTPFFRRRAVIDAAECAMAIAEDFISGMEGDKKWVDPEGHSKGCIYPRARIDAGKLQMTYCADARVIVHLGSVDLPPQWS